MNPEKLAQLQAQAANVRIGGKGTPRRKMKKVHKAAGSDDKKLQSVLKRLNVQAIANIEEVNMFKDDGKVLHFSRPKVHAAVASNVFAIYGNGQEKEITELVPNILTQLGPESLATLRKLAEAYQAQHKAQTGEDGDVPELVENFDEASLEESK